MLVFQYYARQKMGKTGRKVSFINLLYYYYCSPDFLCCFSGFKYPISSNVSSFRSLQDLKVLGLCFGGSGRHFVSLSHLWKSDFVDLLFRFLPQNTEKNYPNWALNIASTIDSSLFIIDPHNDLLPVGLNRESSAPATQRPGLESPCRHDDF